MPSPNFSFLKNTINFEMANVFSIFVFLQYLPLVTISKNHEVRVAYSTKLYNDLTWNYPIKNMNFTDTNYH